MSDDAREALESMVQQFGYWNERVGGLTTGGLSALEEAFVVLGWEDPHPMPSMRCDEEGCMGQATTSGPGPHGWMHRCGRHYLAAYRERNKHVAG